MEYAVVAVPAAPVRRKAGHQQEMVNQLLFGETVKVLKKKGDLWVKIRSLHDDYEGWMTRSLLEETTDKIANSSRQYVTTDLLSVVTIEDKKMHIPVGSTLPSFENGKGMLGSVTYHFSGYCWKRGEQKADPDLINKLTVAWLNVPYLWGGRTPLGVDCSGFVQVIYKLMGIDLPRDAWQQAQEGTPVKKLEDALPGDLAFFDNKEDIVHTGILLGDGKIIHASGKVRIDGITKKGIVDAISGRRTLRLRALRRVIR